MSMFRFHSPRWCAVGQIVLISTTLIGAEDVPRSIAPRADGSTGIPAEANLDAIREAVASSHGRLRSILVEYDARNVNHPDAKLHNHTIVAAKGQARYVKSGHMLGQKDVNDSYAYESVYDGTWFNLHIPHSRQYQISRRFAVPPYTDKCRVEAFLESLGWWPPDDPSAPPKSDGRPLFIQQVLAQDECRVAGDQEQIEGRWCHVVEAPGDRLWIDVPRGTLVRRQLLASGEPPSTSTFELRDYREVEPAIWLPYTIWRELPFYSLESIYQVKAYQVNNVSDSQFSYTPGPGIVVIDRDTDEMHQIPGGLSFLETLCQRALHVLKVAEGSREAPNQVPWLVAMFACGMGGYGMASLLLGWKRRPPTGMNDTSSSAE
jgi:hypothetical protein